GTLYALASLAIALVTAATFAVVVRSPRDLRAVLWTVTTASTVLGLWWIFAYTKGIDRFETQAGDPNFMAAFQVVALPLVLALASSTENPIRRGLLYGAIAVIAGSVISTLSRGGLLTLGAATVLVAVFPARALFRSRTQKLTFFLAAGFGVIMLLSVAWGPLTQRFEAGLQQNHLAGSRGDLWLAAIHGYQQHP